MSEVRANDQPSVRDVQITRQTALKAAAVLATAKGRPSTVEELIADAKKMEVYVFGPINRHQPEEAKPVEETSIAEQTNPAEKPEPEQVKPAATEVAADTATTSQAAPEQDTANTAEKPGADQAAAPETSGETLSNTANNSNSEIEKGRIIDVLEAVRKDNTAIKINNKWFSVTEKTTKGEGVSDLAELRGKRVAVYYRGTLCNALYLQKESQRTAA